MTATFILENNSRVRYATGAMMYFAQGIPAGLLSIAIPAWLASQGVGAAEIASYLAVIVLPWVFKLVENPAEQIGLLMMVGVFINSFAATQDVAVDGMSIDLTPTREHGRLNAFMSFGKSIGWATTSAALDTRQGRIGSSTRKFVSCCIRWAQQSALGWCQSDRDAHHVLRRTDSWLWLGVDADRFGSKRMLILTMIMVGVHALLLAQTQSLWQDTMYVRVMLSLWVMLMPVVMVCVIALAMTICSSGISATQFAVYMSVANLGYSALEPRPMEWSPAAGIMWRLTC